jgi:hypothetical protein
LILLGKEHKNILPAVFEWNETERRVDVVLKTICGNVLTVTCDQAVEVSVLLEGDWNDEAIWWNHQGEFAKDFKSSPVQSR